MAYPALTAFLDGNGLLPSGILITAVLKGGCNMQCPFCIVGKRDERRDDSYLTAEHLITFQSAIARRGLLGGAAIVGDEPLQSHCWPSARAFLDYGNDGKLPTAMVSNGYNLVDFVDEVRRLSSLKLLISLDAVGGKHDAIRRTPGAFARIAKGLAVAARYDDLRERLSIAAIMMPGNMSDLAELISFTAAHRIPQLILSPLLTSSRTDPLTLHPKVMREAWRTIPQLLKQAETEGVKLRLSDEFGALAPWTEGLAESGIEFLTPKEPARVIRIDAAGRVETLATMQAGTTTGLHLPVDVTEIDAFAERVIGTCFEPVAQAA
jgi:sulfatase maturation enzyme AslB (radical SAM superfamily)